jgi:hypothetical protein
MQTSVQHDIGMTGAKKPIGLLADHRVVDKLSRLGKMDRIGDLQFPKA